MIREKRYKSQGRGVRGLAGTTDRVRDSGRGETNNELGRQGPTRSKMPKVKTHPLLAVVESNERSDQVFGKRFVNTIRSDSEDPTTDYLLSIGVEVAGYTLTCIGRENRDFNPSFWGFRKVISSRKEGGQVRNSGVNIIQVERGFSYLRWGSLGNVVIDWRQSGGRRFAGFRVQDPRLLRSSGRRRRKKSNKISRNVLELP